MNDMTPERATALRKPFPKESIGKLPKGGQMLDYVGHAATTDRLLTVDPGWSWEPLALDDRGLPAIDKDGNLWIKLTICGVTRLGVGDGKSAKERIGDAIRNAAMRFGVALDLWAKEDLVEFAHAAAARKVAPTSLADVIPDAAPATDWQARMDACTTADDLRALHHEATASNAGADVLAEIVARGKALKTKPQSLVDAIGAQS